MPYDFKPGEEYPFFSNRDCAYFPCHATADPQDFNCLFCYCPLYTLGEDCGGKFRYTEKGIKDCSCCLVPHHKNSGPAHVQSYFESLSKMARRRE